ncbi:tyrosine-type recombinase/integrase [Aliikangiella marina]|uniref:Tyrosine-type recombinase/integrase n=1 Tax=Aliikangiella marina TaxID=1712262 RepID=A0A545THF9_9GAMM|nr:tyrosine-type recombinase/integrase [Aliikangiella marina]TQV76638.1 tyrosine-type recombinase/integrase [Aliikangiella marina]
MSKLKIPAGVFIHRDKIYVEFRFKGRRYREKPDNLHKITQANINHAERKRNSILVEIKENRFDFMAHFPNSKNASLVDSSLDSKRTVAQGVKNWLAIKEVKTAPSTYSNYVSKSKHVINEFGNERISNISKSRLERFQIELINKRLAPKTVNDIFTIIRGVWGDAFIDEVIRVNPLERIKNIELAENTEADPFEVSELLRLEKLSKKYPYEINMILFSCWTGLSLSEAFGLAWEDIDLGAGKVKVNRARVCPEFKVPKERSRERTIDLVDNAKPWLEAQRTISFMLKPKNILVRQRDNLTKKSEDVSFVFVNPQTNSHWTKPTWQKRFTFVMKAAKLRHRGPNQCRHTFASQLLSAFIPQEWIAHQMGHKDTAMLKKHYGKWIKDDSPNMAAFVSEQLKQAQENEQCLKFLKQNQ